MATGGFADIEERFYTCSVCMSPFEDPKSLPCLHTFCSGCLREYTETRGFAGIGRFPCPLCNNQTTIPHGGVSHFPSNFQLLELIDHIRLTVTSSSVQPGEPGQPAPSPQLPINQAPPFYPQAPPFYPQAPPFYPQALPYPQAPPFYPQAPPFDPQAPPMYPQLAPPTHSSVGTQAPPTSQLAPPTNASSPPTNTNGGRNLRSQPPPRPDQPPLQRRLQANLADHLIPVAENIKGASLVFGRHGNSLTDFTAPIGLANFADKHILISDQRGNRVFIFNLAGRIQSIFTCHGLVQGLAYDPRSGNILIANSKSGRALAKSFNLQGQTKSTIGNQFTHEKPCGIAASKTTLAISSLETNKVFVFDFSGRLIRELGGTGSRQMQLRSPHYLAINSANDVVVSDSGNHCIKVFAAGTGKVKLVIGGGMGNGGKKGSIPGELNNPLGIAVDHNDNIFVCDSGNRRVQCYNTRGKFLGVVVDDIRGNDGRGDSVLARDLAVFRPGKLAVLVTGEQTCEVRIYNYSAKSKGKEDCHVS